MPKARGLAAGVAGPEVTRPLKVLRRSGRSRDSSVLPKEGNDQFVTSQVHSQLESPIGTETKIDMVPSYGCVLTPFRRRSTNDLGMPVPLHDLHARAQSRLVQRVRELTDP